MRSHLGFLTLLFSLRLQKCHQLGPAHERRTQGTEWGHEQERARVPFFGSQDSIRTPFLFGSHRLSLPKSQIAPSELSLSAQTPARGRRKSTWMRNAFTKASKARSTGARRSGSLLSGPATVGVQTPSKGRASSTSPREGLTRSLVFSPACHHLSSGSWMKPQLDSLRSSEGTTGGVPKAMSSGSPPPTPDS